MADGTIEAVLMYIGPGLLTLYFAYFKRATNAEKNSRWHDRSNPSMVEKALEEALHDKVVCTVAQKSSIPKHLCLPSEVTTALAQCSVCSACTHLKERRSDSGDRPLGVNSPQGDYFKIDKRRRPQRQPQRRRREDEDGKTAMAMKKKEASS